MRAAIMGAVTGGFAAKIGMMNHWNLVRKAGAHGLVGGISNVVQGGKFGRGFATSFLGKVASPVIKGAAGDGSTWSSRLKGGLTAGLVGGTISKMTGGKFGNGAMTNSLQYLFNEVGNKIRKIGFKEVTGKVEWRNTDPSKDIKFEYKAYVADVLGKGVLGKVARWVFSLSDPSVTLTVARETQQIQYQRYSYDVWVGSDDKLLSPEYNIENIGPPYWINASKPAVTRTSYSVSRCLMNNLVCQ